MTRNTILGIVWALWAAAGAVGAPPETILFEDATVIDGTGRAPLEHARLLVREGRIEAVEQGPSRGAIPKGIRVIRLTGKTIIPGLINAHGHLGITQGNTAGPQNYTAENISRQLAQYERYGVTTVVSLGLNRDLVYDLRARQKRGELGGAEILTAGRGFGVPGGVPPMKLAEDQVYRPASAEEARRQVRETAAHRPDIIKIWVDHGPGLSTPDPEVYAAIIDEAHKHGIKAAAHVFYLEDAKRLVRDGVDLLAHSIRDKPVDDELIAMMKRRATGYIPTLALEESFFVYADGPAWMKTDFFRGALSRDVQELFDSAAWLEKTRQDSGVQAHRALLERARENLARIARAGMPVGFGTDSGAFPSRVQGLAEHRELALMVEAGIAPVEAIHSATGRNARLLGIEARAGTLEPGKQADLVVLDGDPSKTIANTTRVVSVWHRGVEVVPAHEAHGAEW